MREVDVPFESLTEEYLGFYYKYTSTVINSGLTYETYILITGIRIGRNSEGAAKHITLNPDEKTETTFFEQYTESITVAWKD